MAPNAASAIKRKAVANALRLADENFADVCSMLSKGVDFSLGVRKQDRDESQKMVVEMIKTVLDSVETNMKATVTTEAEKVTAADSEKATRAAAAEAAKASYDEKAGVSSEKKAARDAAKKGLDEARAALTAAASAEDAAKALQSNLQAKKDQLEGFRSGSLEALKSGTELEKATVKEAVSTLKRIAREFAIDGFMAESVKEAIERPSGERTTFDGFVVKELEEELANHSSDLDGQLQASAASVQEKGAQVESAKAAADSAGQALDAATKDAQDAKAAADADRETLQAANSAVKEYEPEVSKAHKDHHAVEAKLDKFKKGALRAYVDLNGDYEDVEGVVCDRDMVGRVRASAGSNSRVTLQAAKDVFRKAAESGDLSRVERWTLRYCLTSFAWDEDAHDYIVTETKNLPNVENDQAGAKRRKTTGYYKTLDGVKLDAGVIDACNKAVEGAGDGRVSIEDAKAVYEKLADNNQVTQTERWTLRYCLMEYKWTAAAAQWICGEMNKIGQGS